MVDVGGSDDRAVLSPHDHVVDGLIEVDDVLLQLLSQFDLLGPGTGARQRHIRQGRMQDGLGHEHRVELGVCVELLLHQSFDEEVQDDPDHHEDDG